MPQGAWSPKRDRQYEHIKDSELDAGRSEDRAEEIAARTVNKRLVSCRFTRTCPRAAVRLPAQPGIVGNQGCALAILLILRVSTV